MTLIDKLKILLISIVLFCLVLLAFPEFRASVAGREINFNSIDLKPLGLDATFGSFTPGKDIFESTRYIYEVVAPEADELDKKEKELEYILATIKERADYVGLYDIEINSRVDVSTDQVFIEIEVPNSYSDAEILTDTLTKRGSIELFAIDQETNQDIVELSLNDLEDVRSGLYSIALAEGSAPSLESSQYTLLLELKDDSVEKIEEITNFIISSGEEANYQLGINVDSFQSFNLFPDPQNENWLRGLPASFDLAGSEDESTEENFVRINQHFFFEERPFEYSLVSTNQNVLLEENYATNGYSFLALGIGLSVLILIHARKNMFNKVNEFSYYLINYILISLITFAFLKLFKFDLSFSTIIGALLLTLILDITLTKFIEMKEGLDINLSKFRYYNIFALICIVVVLRLNLNIDQFVNIFGMIFALNIASLLASVTFMKFLYRVMVVDKNQFSDLFKK